jgi:hypothetical protein
MVTDVDDNYLSLEWKGVFCITYSLFNIEMNPFICLEMVLLHAQ